MAFNFSHTRYRFQYYARQLQINPLTSRVTCEVYNSHTAAELKKKKIRFLCNRFIISIRIQFFFFLTIKYYNNRFVGVRHDIFPLSRKFN